MSSLLIAIHNQDNNYIELRWDKYEPHFELIVGTKVNGLIRVKYQSRYTTKERGKRAFDRQVQKVKLLAEIGDVLDLDTSDKEELIKAYESNSLDYGFEYGNYFNFSKNPKQVCIQWVDGQDYCEFVADNLPKALDIIDKIVKGKGHIDKGIADYWVVCHESDLFS